MKNDDLYYYVMFERVELLSRLLVNCNSGGEHDREIALAWINDLCCNVKQNDSLIRKAG